MKTRSAVSAVFAVACAAVSLVPLGGCKGAQYSQEDMARIKQGPPKEMPAEAIKVMQEAAQKRAANAGRR